MALEFWIPIAAMVMQSATTPLASTADLNIRDAKDLLFGTTPASPILSIPRGSGKANLCAASDAARRLYPGTGIGAVTRDVPFMPFPDLNGGPCSVYSHADPVPMRGSSFQATFDKCSVSFRVEQGRQIIDIAPRRRSRDDRFVLSECFYRIALYIEGYRGALQMPRFRLFVSTEHGFWAGQAQFVGKSAVLTPFRLSLLCPDLKMMYYRDDLPRRLRGAASRRSAPPLRPEAGAPWRSAHPPRL